MMTDSAIRPSKARRAVLFTAVSIVAASAALAQAPQVRITSAIDNQSRATLPGTLSPRALPANDVGAVPAATKLQGITLVFSRTAAQQAALTALIAAQQDPASPQYHQWLTPAQFGAEFGAAPSDIAAVEAWLQQQGFTIDAVSNSRDRIQFTGTEAQVESAFGTQLHYFKSASGTHFAPATAITVPSAIASSVLTVTNLSNFRARPHVKVHAPVAAKPNFTSSQSGDYFLDPDDVATIYNITAAYNAGYTGAGQSIAIIGQSAVVPSDITNFQTALGIPVKAPTEVLVPNTGTPEVYSGDEVESDLDLEYSGATAKGATIYFIYTGDSTTAGVYPNSLQYAVDYDIAPIISTSYGDCETDLGQAEYTQLNNILQQAATQGQSVIAAAGDDGSTDCSGDTDLTTAQQEALAVDFPADSQYVTGMGGTEFPAADVTAPNTTYWTSSTGADVLSSAKSYIPEQVWNDDNSTDGISSGGGGVSAFTPRPTWQTGVTGIPAGNFRLVPDISLAASPNYPGYLYCSSDPATDVTGSCSNGFRDANNDYLTVAGGTSFDAPQFAGILALINQARGYTAGQGVIDPTLYTLAANAATYASAFHDITSGSNDCLVGLGYCSAASASEYPATTGYDEASGLGSLNVYNLLTAWPASSSVSSGLTATTTTVTPATLTPGLSANDTVTIAVTGAITPTGTVSVSVNGTVVNPTLPLTNGVATYTFSSSVAGPALISATYSGSPTLASSTGTASLNVDEPVFTLAVPNITLANGSSGTATITVTPVNGYTGIVELSLSQGGAFGSSTSTCVGGSSTISVTGSAPVTEALTFYTTAATCSAAGLVVGTIGQTKNGFSSRAALSLNHGPAHSRWPGAPIPAAFAGLLIVGCFRRRSRLLRGGLALGILALLCFSGLGLTGCSSNAPGAVSTTTTTTSTLPAGTYTLILTGADSVNGAVNTYTTFNITVN